MKSLAVALLTIFMFSPPALGDIVFIETNNWNLRSKLIWSGTLQKIDTKTQIAHFTYQNNSKEEEFKVHVTRIYSLQIDNQNRVNRPFPPTRENLETPLDTNPHSIRTIELSNQNSVGQRIPEEVVVRPDRVSLILYLNGDVKTVNLPQIILKVRNDKGDMSEFEIQRSDLLKWVR